MLTSQANTMYEIILILIVLATVCVAFNLQTAIDARRLRQEITDTSHTSAATDTDETESRTIDLIGREAYRAMTERIDGILRKHAHHPCLSLDLTCAPTDRDGADELHRLLPGAELHLLTCNQGGVGWIDVYSNGLRVGRLALLEADAVGKILRCNHVCGVYVSEQNCFGIEDSHRLSLIIFYEDKQAEERQSIPAPSKSRSSDTALHPAPVDFCKN